MSTRFGSRLVGLALSAVAGAVALAVSAQAPVKAQAAYGSYIGIGPAFGDGDIAVAINGRYNILEIPVSIRGAAFLGEGSAFVPTVSYDYPLNFNTELYVGAGVVFGDDDSVMGDGTSFVLQPGIDYTVNNSSLVWYGNAIVPIGGDNSTAIQGGVGIQF
ncbi:MAG: hypothetical protein AAFV85_27000 [Cyanobacteria bacterium J06634_6]